MLIAPHTVLVLEDDDTRRRSLVDALQTAGLRVLAAGAAVEALALLEQEPRPRVVVTDRALDGRLAEALVRRHGVRAVYVDGFVPWISFGGIRTTFVDSHTDPHSLARLVSRLAASEE
jgi:ActR/RegA family two-component response regulator